MAKHSGHHILSVKSALIVWICLMILTVVTVWVAQFNFGAWNFTIGMLIATVKASLVVLFFMGLKYDAMENRMIFIASLVFFAIFMVLTFMDFGFRPVDYKVQGQFFAEVDNQKSKFDEPWKPTSELVAHGKEIYMTQCMTCHGMEGKGNGPAGVAFNPRPRNFTQAEGWKNGRKPTQVWKTLENGLGSMPAFTALSPDDRWGVIHYVLSLGPSQPSVTKADLAAAGIDLSGSGKKEQKLPLDFALERMAID